MKEASKTFTYTAQRTSYISTVCALLFIMVAEVGLIIFLIAKFIQNELIKFGLIFALVALFLNIGSRLLAPLWTKHRLNEASLQLHYGLEFKAEISRNTIITARQVRERVALPLARYEAEKERIFAAFSDQGQVLLVLDQSYPFRVGLFGSSKLANQLLINVDQRDEFLADLALQATSTARGDASVPTPLPATPLTPTKWRKGIAKKAKQKENPFTRSLQERKEFLMMTHDSADQSAKQLPIPSEQHLMSCVTHMSLALVSSGKRRGRPETLTTLHLCLGVVL